GVAGEICIGGVGVARGYVGRGDLTAERFVPDPFVEGRLYRTGGVGRWRRDGTLEYLGRMDSQLKVRGHRIQPGEIEAQLVELGASKAGCIGRKTVWGTELVAYVVGEVEPEALRVGLRQRVPEPMVPSRIVRLEALPLTANGKLDVAALPEPAAVVG